MVPIPIKNLPFTKVGSMKTFLIFFLITSFAQAQISEVTIKNFNFLYSAPTGEGVADLFFYQKNNFDPQKVSVEKIGEEFKIHLEGVENQEIILSNPPGFLKNAQDMKLTSFNLNLKERAVVSMGSGVFHSPDEDINLKNFTLSCDRIISHPELMDQIVAGCVQKMFMKAGGFASEGGEGVTQAFIKAIDRSFEPMTGGFGLKNVELKIFGGKFDLTGDIKAQISGTAEANGSMKYDVVAKKLTVKVSEIKFGYFDVTSKVFDELKKQESQNLKVKEPYLYLMIK